MSLFTKNSYQSHGTPVATKSLHSDKDVTLVDAILKQDKLRCISFSSDQSSRRRLASVVGRILTEKPTPTYPTNPTETVVPRNFSDTSTSLQDGWLWFFFEVEAFGGERLLQSHTSLTTPTEHERAGRARGTVVPFSTQIPWPPSNPPRAVRADPEAPARRARRRRDVASSHGSPAMCAARASLRGLRVAAPPEEQKPAEGRRPRPAPPRR